MKETLQEMRCETTGLWRVEGMMEKHKEQKKTSAQDTSLRSCMTFEIHWLSGILPALPLVRCSVALPDHNATVPHFSGLFN